MQNITSLFSHKIIKDIDNELEKVFQNVPHLPKKAVEILAKIAPYLTLVSGLFLITGGLRSIFGANDFYRIFNAWKGVPPLYFYLTGLLQILAGVISISIYKPLKNYELKGWFGLLCLSILGLVMNLVSVFFFKDGLFGLLFSLAVSLYILYEVKPEYGLVGTIINKVEEVKAKVAKVKTEIKKVETEIKSKNKKK
jgi:hypothetical protein